MEPQSPPPPPTKTGIPRWLVIGIAVKLLVVTAITVAVIWWAKS